MSDHSISIVPKQSNYPGRANKAAEILTWLVSTNIVKPTLSDCILGSNQGYAISVGAKKVSTEPQHLPFELRVNGLEIILERQVFQTGQNGIDQVICPSCAQDISNEDWDFLNEWSEGNSNNLTCPSCIVSTEIHQFNFSPEWGFANLGFVFWNWPPLTQNFIRELKHKLGCAVNVVHTRI